MRGRGWERCARITPTRRGKILECRCWNYRPNARAVRYGKLTVITPAAKVRTVAGDEDIPHLPLLTRSGADQQLLTTTCKIGQGNRHFKDIEPGLLVKIM